MSYSAIAEWLAPKVFVSTQSTPDAEVLLVDRADDVRAGDVQDLVAAFEVLEVLEGGVLRLEHGAHRSVGDHHAGGEGLSERGHTGPAVGGRGQWRRGHERGSLECDGCRLCGFPGNLSRNSPGSLHVARVTGSGGLMLRGVHGTDGTCRRA
jgi:hypothetical protein